MQGHDLILQVTNDTHLKYDETQKKRQAHHHTNWKRTQRMTCCNSRIKWFNTKHRFCSSVFIFRILVLNLSCKDRLNTYVSLFSPNNSELLVLAFSPEKQKDRCVTNKTEEKWPSKPLHLSSMIFHCLLFLTALKKNAEI